MRRLQGREHRQRHCLGAQRRASVKVDMCSTIRQAPGQDLPQVVLKSYGDFPFVSKNVVNLLTRDYGGEARARAVAQVREMIQCMGLPRLAAQINARVRLFHGTCRKLHPRIHLPLGLL